MLFDVHSRRQIRLGDPLLRLGVVDVRRFTRRSEMGQRPLAQEVLLVARGPVCRSNVEDEQVEEQAQTPERQQSPAPARSLGCSGSAGGPHEWPSPGVETQRRSSGANLARRCRYFYDRSGEHLRGIRVETTGQENQAAGLADRRLSMSAGAGSHAAGNG
jgi:hypothetical protein